MRASSGFESEGGMGSGGDSGSIARCGHPLTTGYILLPGEQHFSCPSRVPAVLLLCKAFAYNTDNRQQQFRDH